MYQDVEWQYPLGTVVQLAGRECAVIAHGVQWNALYESLEPVYQVTEQFTKPSPQNAGWITEDAIEPRDA